MADRSTMPASDDETPRVRVDAIHSPSNKQTPGGAIQLPGEPPGKSLFEAYAISKLGTLFGMTQGLNSANLANLWAKLPTTLRTFWIQAGSAGDADWDTDSLGRQEHLTMSILAVAEPGTLGPRSAVWHVLRVLEVQVDATSGRALIWHPSQGKTPILNAIIQGRGSREARLLSNMTIILERIRQLRQTFPALRIVGRNAGVRINFDPDATDITSIAARLRFACSRGLTYETKHDKFDVRENWEWLLRPLVFWNRHTPGSLNSIPLPTGRNNRDIWMPRGAAGKFNGSDFYFSSSLRWIEPQLEDIRPLTAVKKKEAVEFLMRKLHDHIRRVHPGQADTVISGTYEDESRPSRKWNLASEDHGLTFSLMKCFAREWLSSDEYEDLLEQEFFALRRFLENDKRIDDMQLHVLPRMEPSGEQEHGSDEVSSDERGSEWPDRG